MLLLEVKTARKLRGIQPTDLIIWYIHPCSWGTGIRGLMRGMATLPEGNQELLVVRAKLEDPQVSLG